MDHADKANVILAWTAHPARAQLGKAVAALLVIALFGAGVALTAGHWLPGVLGPVVLLASMQRFFFPSTFTIDDEGISARHLLTSKRLLWRDARRFACDANGGYLSTRATPNWTDAYRGVHIVFGRSRDEAVAAIRARITLSRDPESAEGSASELTRRHAVGTHS